MKLITLLPESKHYRSLPTEREDVWLFGDKSTTAARIASPTPSPWGKQWKIIPSMQMQKGDKSKWPYRLVLRLFPLDGEGEQVRFEREEVKGVFAWSDYQPLLFYAFPTERQHIWIFYSFYN